MRERERLLATEKFVSIAGHVSKGARVSAPYVWHVKDETPAWMKKEVWSVIWIWTLNRLQYRR